MSTGLHQAEPETIPCLGSCEAMAAISFLGSSEGIFFRVDSTPFVPAWQRPNPRQHRGWFVGGPVQLKWPRL